MATSTRGMQKVGNYRLGTTLGVGSFGKVKLGEHVETKRKVAVKILNRRKIKVQQMEEKLKREIKILKACMHPHIIRLYEVIETPTEIYVVTEYSSGGELFDYIVERGRLSENDARRFFQQIVAGVEYCHKHMVAHRDLKPENLLLDEHFNVKIADFGLSNCMRDGWFLKTSCGSPNYAAPEVISGKLYAGPEVDVWSCGVIVYALLCGSLPFEDESIPYLFRKIKGGLFILPSYLSDMSRDLINKMLVVDPLRRITIEDIRKHPWFTTRLPKYIAFEAPIFDHLENINKEILNRAAKTIEADPMKMLRALKKGRRNRLTAPYHLLKDALDELDTSIVEDVAAPKTAPHTPDISDTPDAPDTPHVPDMADANGPKEPASPMVIEKPVTSSENVHMHGTTPAVRGSTERNGTATENGQHARPDATLVLLSWEVGLVITKASAPKVMMDVYRAFHRLNWRWKTPAQGNFHVRVMVNEDGLDNEVRIAVQLFKTHNGFQIDLQKLGGRSVSYLGYCAELMTEIHKGLAGLA